MSEVLQQFKEHLKKMDAYSHAMGVLEYDSVTAMPHGGSTHLAETCGFLSGEMYKLMTDSAFKENIAYILSHKDEFDHITFREAEELHEDMERTEKIPMDEYIAYTVETNEASAVWHKAKAENDYASFEPYLDKIVEFNRRFASYWDPSRPKYDVLLDQYEKGLSKAALDVFFDGLRTELVPLIRQISEASQPEDGFAHEPVPIEKQRLLSDYLMQVMTIDREHCSIGETEHPFTTDFTKDDVRITTHYHETEMFSNVFSVIHEGGHALYELHTGDDLKGSPLGTGCSMGIHESQSRFYENIIGRSEAFISYIYPEVKRIAPKVFANVSAHDFYRAANVSRPSLIRTEADELTYPFHIMIRYDIEKELIEGDLKAKDVPALWNKLYKEYLGVDVPDDRSGALQDSHWSGGMIGYFPSYALGSAYGAQILAHMEKEIPVWEHVARGELAPIVAWLTEKIYRYGKLLTPQELIMNACGEPFDPSYYIAYLKEKYSKLYSL